MSTTATYDRALDLMSKARGEGAGAMLLATAKTVLAAMADGLSAAHDYRRLTSGGLAPDAAARRVFADHFRPRCRGSPMIGGERAPPGYPERRSPFRSDLDGL